MEDARHSFVRVVHRLVAGDGAPGKLLGLGALGAFVEMSDNTVAMIVCAGDDLAPVRDKMREVIEGNPGIHFKIVMVGGGEEARALVERAQPRLMIRRMVQAFHLDARGQLWTGRSTREDSPMGRLLAAVAGGEGPTDVTPEQLVAHLQDPPGQNDVEAAREHKAFVLRIRSRRPWATWALLTSIAIVFGLEASWGGTELVPTLVRMGANTDRALDDQPWRLLSSAFLHAGPAHVLVNGYVLYALGGFIERIVGWPRFLLLYGASALGGGVASAALSEAGLSVGASGAIWGLLGAAAALAWRPNGMLPRNLVAPMRRTAVINLVINLSVSFLPQVDMMAHLGGGLVGASLVLTGALTRGLPSDEPASTRPEPVRRRWVAAAVALVLYGSLGCAWVTGRPWALVSTPQWRRVELEPGLSVEIPAILGEPMRRPGRPGEIVWWIGDPGRDPLDLVIGIVPAIELEGEALRAAVETLRASPSLSLASTEPLGERTHPGSPGVVWEERFRYATGARVAVRLIRLPEAEVLVRLDWWEDAPPPWPEQAVERVLRSIRPVERTTM